MNNQAHNTIVSFIWGIADDCLRDVYVRGKYRDVILPMTVIRRLDAMLEGSKATVLEMKKKMDAAGITNQWPALCNERDVNVRIGPGVDKPILKAWPKLGPGNEVDVTGEGQAPNGRLWYQIRIAGVHTGWVYGGYLDKR